MIEKPQDYQSSNIFANATKTDVEIFEGYRLQVINSKKVTSHIMLTTTFSIAIFELFTIVRVHSKSYVRLNVFLSVIPVKNMD